MRAAIALLRGVSSRVEVERGAVSGKVFASVIGTLLVGVAGYVGVYLPYYSEGSMEARERAAASGIAAARRRAGNDSAPGSVWKNITIKRESAGDAGSSGPTEPSR